MPCDESKHRYQHYRAPTVIWLTDLSHTDMGNNIHKITEPGAKLLEGKNLAFVAILLKDGWPQISQAFASQIESKAVAFQKFLTEQNNLRAIKVVAYQTVVHAEATARANVPKAIGESQAIKLITVQIRVQIIFSGYQLTTGME